MKIKKPEDYDLTEEIAFGKYRGRRYGEVGEEDPEYMRWIADKSDRGCHEKNLARLSIDEPIWWITDEMIAEHKENYPTADIDRLAKFIKGKRARYKTVSMANKQRRKKKSFLRWMESID